MGQLALSGPHHHGHHGGGGYGPWGGRPWWGGEPYYGGEILVEEPELVAVPVIDKKTGKTVGYQNAPKGSGPIVLGDDSGPPILPLVLVAGAIAAVGWFFLGRR